MSRFSRSDDGRLRQELDDAVATKDAALSEAHRLRSALDAVQVGIVLVDAAGNVVLRNSAATFGGHADVLVGDVITRLSSAARGGAARRREGQSVRAAVAGADGARRAAARGWGARQSSTISANAFALDAVRTDFVSNISHELKTPVGALALLAETLADSDDMDVNRRLAEKMVDEAHRAAGTIDDLLELSRIELGGQGEQEQVSVTAVLRDATARHHLTAESFGVNVEVLDSNGLVVEGNRLQLVSAPSATSSTTR